MSAAPARAAGAWTAIVELVAHAFTRPGFAVFADLVAGWVLTPGRRTITRIIGVIDAEGRRAHDAYHRLIRDGRWSMRELWRVMAVTVVARLVPADGDVACDLDDTLLHKSGRRIDGAGIFRDAVRSTTKRVVYALGLNLVVVTVRVTPPWGGMPVGVPVNLRVRRKDGGHTLVDLARQMLTELADWLPERTLQLACDGAYASLCGAGLERVHITTRIRRDAAVYELTPPRTGRRGRPRKKGDRLPPLPALAAVASDWVRVTYDQRGTPVDRLVWSRPLLWYGVARDTPLLLVVVRDPDGREPDDFFITTDVDADPAWVAAHYAGRWSIEVTFRDTKQHLGAEDPQCWKRQGPRTRRRARLLAARRRVPVVHHRLGRQTIMDAHPLVPPQDHTVVPRRARRAAPPAVAAANYSSVLHHAAPRENHAPARRHPRPRSLTNALISAHRRTTQHHPTPPHAAVISTRQSSNSESPH